MEVFDYILVYAADEDELKAKLCELLKQLQAAGLTINRDKCVFPVDKLEFWGYHVTTTPDCHHSRGKQEPSLTSPTKVSQGPAQVPRHCQLLPVVSSQCQWQDDSGNTPTPLAATDKTPGNKFIDKWQELGLDADYMASRHLKQPQTLWSTFKLELYNYTGCNRQSLPA